MKRRPVLVLVAAFLGASACVAWDYAGALQTCVDTHIGDPQGREQCICQTAQDAGRSCAFLDGGAE